MAVAVDPGDWEVKSAAEMPGVDPCTLARYAVVFRCGGFHRWVSREDAERMHEELGRVLGLTPSRVHHATGGRDRADPPTPAGGGQ